MFFDCEESGWESSVCIDSSGRNVHVFVSPEPYEEGKYVVIKITELVKTEYYQDSHHAVLIFVKNKLTFPVTDPIILAT